MAAPGFSTFPANTSDEVLRDWVRLWVELLAAARFEKAAAQLYPEVIPNNGSINSVKYPVWTGALIEKVIGYGGTPEPITGDTRFARVILVEDSFRPEFERLLTVERTPYSQFGIAYLGGIHVDLPLELGSFRGIGNLTVRFLLKDLGEEQLALVLEDIHIL